MACYCFAHNQSFFKCLIYSDLSKKAKNIFNFYLDFNWELQFIGLLSYSSCLSRYPLLELLYAPIISAIGNVVDFMVGASELVSIEFAQGACQPDKPVRYLLQGGTGKFGKHLQVLFDGV